MTEAVIFDMDGLLVDSEPYWRVAEQNVFGRLSKAPGENEFEKMMGNRIQEVIRSWYEKNPWENFSPEQTQQEIVEEVHRLVIAHASLLPGVQEIFSFFRSRNIPVALASSSPYALIESLMHHYGLIGHFKTVHSAENEPYGKPHPAVFITTAYKLGIDPQKCLVFEDSFNGIIAAKAARMKCVAVPAKEHFAQERFSAADMKLKSLLEFTEEKWRAVSDEY
ncbi:MAG TPA: hexitol phosphatase HxpB [Bacteroidia bacterium]|nr:hexitol phosphatase HxpB [Bacteroidia bacterium]